MYHAIFMTSSSLIITDNERILYYSVKGKSLIIQGSSCSVLNAEEIVFYLLTLQKRDFGYKPLIL